jgi:hypothetical protein
MQDECLMRVDGLRAQEAALTPLLDSPAPGL